jgi:zona occludens toxin
MIIIHEGVPGAGKSYDAVKKILAALKKGRTIYTNIDGLDRPECLEYISSYIGTTREDLADILFFIEKGKIQNFWDYTAEGSLIVIDEAQLFFNSRDFSKQSNREFSDWASTHRHHGYDLILITQRAERIDTAVRSLAEFKYRYRKLSFFGSMFNSGFMVYNYIGDDPKHMSFAKRSYEKEIFPAYNSYVGDATEQKFHKAPNVFKHPVFLSLPLIFAAFIYFASSSNLFSSPLDISGNTNNSEPELTKTINPLLPVQKKQPETKPTPEGKGFVQVVDIPDDEIRIFPVSAYIEKNGRKYVMVHNVLLFNYEHFDISNMVVGIYPKDIPAALQYKLNNPDRSNLRQSQNINSVNYSSDSDSPYYATADSIPPIKPLSDQYKPDQFYIDNL